MGVSSKECMAARTRPHGGTPGSPSSRPSGKKATTSCGYTLSSAFCSSSGQWELSAMYYPWRSTWSNWAAGVNLKIDAPSRRAGLGGGGREHQPTRLEPLLAVPPAARRLGRGGRQLHRHAARLHALFHHEWHRVTGGLVLSLDQIATLRDGAHPHPLGGCRRAPHAVACPPGRVRPRRLARWHGSPVQAGARCLLESQERI
ncbi:hypothetical protein B0T25DRAFT_54166 [Lasiosphaeria hispida]|uniref:Uncharacterized protein n=1 Tax=Lasiosphaeria hispida TaxID=260671 RepID=A0AAJ0MKH2_9PEZI|nr:hypothetical protein B0T25DRAFT_54166 [Lasiosphaeria hispida]